MGLTKRITWLQRISCFASTLPIQRVCDAKPVQPFPFPPTCALIVALFRCLLTDRNGSRMGVVSQWRPVMPANAKNTLIAKGYCLCLVPTSV